MINGAAGRNGSTTAAKFPARFKFWLEWDSGKLDKGVCVIVNKIEKSPRQFVLRFKKLL